MPRAHTLPDYADPARDPNTGEWQALRGELVALLDKVESHYGQVEDEQPAPPASALAQRVRNLRNQVVGSETNSRHREALRTVKRAVDRFSDRDMAQDGPGMPDELTAAIAEIRSRQGAAPTPMPMRRASDLPELRELGALVGGMSQRLERLEGELKTQRSSASHVREVAGQVEQLTQVVELLAGAVGETGQVKRLEAQIAALGAMIEEGPRNDLSTLNARLDDVSTTVGKLAELQAQQMEREIARDQRRNAQSDPAETLAPAMRSIEDGVRNVYDRIDAIEQTVSLSSADFEKLTSEMAAFTQAMQTKGDAPDALAGQLDALMARLDGIDARNEQVDALRADMAALRQAVLDGMEPRFSQIENKLEILSDRIVPVNTKAVEDQLKLLMNRMDEAGAQLDVLARQKDAGERPDFESLATMVAERTSEAVSRKAPAPVAMFGPESLKSIEDRLAGLIKSAGKTPDYEQLADLVATRATEAMSKVPAAKSDDMDALEKRMAALLNTAGQETAERLARLEAVLSKKTDTAVAAPAPAPAPQTKASPASQTAAPRPAAAQPPAARSQFDEILEASEPENDRLDSILASLASDRRDAMPENPADEKPLIDKGFGDKSPVRQALSREASRASAPMAAPAAPKAPSEPAAFDPSRAERPPRPRSSFAELDADPFAPAARPSEVKPEEPRAVTSNTSTFVAAARRAQRAKQDETPTDSTSNSIIGRALARVRSKRDSNPTEPAAPKPEVPAQPIAAEPPKPVERKRPKRAKKGGADETGAPVLPEANADKRPDFLTRYRRPLLLAATLTAVSLLTLNLVLQRMGPASPSPSAAVSTPDAPAAASPEGSDDVSSIIPPRVIDLVDTTATGSINPGEPMSFSRDNKIAPATPMPPTLMADGGRIALATTSPKPDAPEVTGSIGPAAEVSGAAADMFDLPPEAIGPLELRQAAANGNAKAQFEVAAILGEGRAVEKDLEASALWYQRSAAQGFVPAQYRLGNLYEMGNGVEKDLEQARLWYQRSAEAGNRMAMHNLAALYAGGALGDQQFELAAEWFDQAANRGMTDSQFNLGMLYARGLGVEQDFEQSYKWFSLAALSGDRDASKAREDIAKSLTAEAVSRIGAEVNAWTMEQVDLAANFAPIGTWSDAFDPGEAIGNAEVIAKVQQALTKLGFEVGTADGVIGPKTRDAIRAFERATGMSETGDINPRLLAVLGSQPV
ncbi:peptidoglycan-binding protein [Devosia sp. Naph2]|uniref:peptidoglycan-binding protein n=1 Tax=Devosia polycyclovorans TaxID=3345148 RepID=UPI0035D0674D